jgi:hypothetical protein
MERRDVIEQHMTQEQRIDALRFDFQERVGKHSLAPWTITEAEAKGMLAGNSVAVLLMAFTSTGVELKRLRTERLVFLTEEATLGLLDEQIFKYRRREGRKTDHIKAARGVAA